MSMFPIQLSYYLATPVENITLEAVHALLPGLDWGEESDLMKHSDDWPEAVVLIKNRFGYEPDERCDFPVEINLVHFPGRVTGNDSVMLPTKLALLRQLAAAFECRVLCGARGFCVEEERSIHAYAWTESFLCQSGRVFSGAVPEYDAREGARPSETWIPLDELPAISLKLDGRLIDQEAATAQLAGWIKVRDSSHLREPGHPIPPKRPPEPVRPPLTPEEIEAEIAEEFPSEEETDREESEWEAYTERLDAWEKGIETTASKQLISGGVALPAPDSLSDEALPGKLWEVIHGLREKNTYLHNTDHLSDRELYTWLWEEGLNEGVMDLSGLSDCGCQTSPIGSGDEESSRISLTYYDSAEKRADWKASWPKDPISAHIDLPHDRDRLLPQREPF